MKRETLSVLVVEGLVDFLESLGWQRDHAVDANELMWEFFARHRR